MISCSHWGLVFPVAGTWLEWAARGYVLPDRPVPEPLAALLRRSSKK